MEEVLRELALDSDSDIEPDDDFCVCVCVPDGDDFVAESSDEALLDEPAYFSVKLVWKVFTTLSPFSTWLFFC